jgi:hypothetical protein
MEESNRKIEALSAIYAETILKGKKDNDDNPLAVKLALERAKLDREVDEAAKKEQEKERAKEIA